MLDRREVRADLVRAARLEPHAQQAVRGSRSTTSKWVTALRARSVRVDITVRLPRSRPIGASMVPLSASGCPSTSAVYSRVTSRALIIRLERRVGLLRARHHEQPGGVAVEAVHDPGPLRMAVAARRRASASASVGRGGPAPGA